MRSLSALDFGSSSIMYKKILTASFLFLSTAAYVHAEEESATHTISGNIGLVSKYIYRGGVENNDLAIQGGLGYTHKSGFLAEYWGSTLDYDSSDDSKTRGFESDFYIGYGRDLTEDLSVSTKLAAYFYHRGGSVYNEDRSEKRRTTGTEWLAEVDYKNLAVSMAVALSDVNYGNAGDVYLSAAYSYDLPYDFALNTLVGVNIFNSSQDDSLVETSKDLVFNEARLGLSKSFPDVGVDMTLDYIWGGKDRVNDRLDDHLVFGVSYSF